MLVAAIVVIFPLCLAYAAFSDMFTMTIPNRVSIILIVSFALIAPLTGMAWRVYAQHFAARCWFSQSVSPCSGSV